MKKRLFVAALAIFLVFAMCVPAFAAWTYPTTAPTNLTDLMDTTATPIYSAQATAAPTIDGTVDDVWEKAATFTSGKYSVSTLWDENNVYILETRQDNTISGTTDNDKITSWDPGFDYSLFVFATPATMANNACAPIAIYVSPSTTLNGKAAGEIEPAFVTMRKLLFTNISTGAQTKPFSGADANVKAQREKITAYLTRTATGYQTEMSIPWSALCFGNTAATGDNAYVPTLGDVVGFRAYGYQKGTGDSGTGNYTTDTGSDNGGFTPLNLVKRAPSAVIDINSVAEFKDFIEEAAAGNTFGGKTINLNVNVDLNPGWDASVVKDANGLYTLPEPAAYEWPMIPQFSGIFDGNGHTISGIYVEPKTTTKNEYYVAPFQTLKNGTIKNTAFVNSFVCADGSTGRNANATSQKIGGVVGNAMNGALLENLYVDVTVWATSTNYHYEGGVAAETSENYSVFRNIVANGVVGSSLPGTGATAVNTHADTCPYALLSQLNWKTGVLLDQVVIAGEIHAAAGNKNTDPYGYNTKFKSDDMQTGYKASNCVVGKFDTFEAATAAGAVLNKAGTATNTYVYSPVLGGIAPATVVHLFDYNLAVQQKAAYKLADKNSVEHDVIDVRLLTTVNDLEVCNRIGYKVSVKTGSAEAVEKVITVSEVYSSIQAAGATITAAELGGKYISALVLQGVSATENVTITVTPVKVIGETTYEDPTPYVINVAAGVIQ